MRAHYIAPVLLLLCAGCSHLTKISTHNSDYEEVWLGTLDAVSDHLHIEQADKKRGLIIARSDTRWVRSEARIEIVQRGSQYDVSATAKDEKLRVLLKPSGLRTGEDREVLDDNYKLAAALLKQIKERVGKMPPILPAPKPKPKAEPKPETKAAPEPKPKPAPKPEAKAAPKPKEPPAKTQPAVTPPKPDAKKK